MRTTTPTNSTQPIRQASLREHNLALVMSIILGASVPPSRADISGATGLTRATVSALVDALLEGSMVTELAPTITAKAGRPAVPLIPASRTFAGIGLEIAVDHIGVRAVDLAGNLLADELLPGGRRDRDAPEVLAQARARTETLVRSLRSQRIKVAGIMVALPGLVDRHSGILRLAPNLGWRDVDVAAEFAQSELFSTIKVTAANEAKLAAVAELSEIRSSRSTTSSDTGSGADTAPDTDPRPTELANFVYVSGEVGIGSALMIDGSILGGQHGWAGELGHVVVEPEGPECGCGARGCLEQYAGRTILMTAAGLDQGSPIEALVKAAETGGLAAEALGGAAIAIGIALADMLNIVDVDTVILGGIYSPLSPWLTAGIESELRTRVLAAPWTNPRVLPARMGPQAVRAGAALAALTPVRQAPINWL